MQFKCFWQKFLSGVCETPTVLYGLRKTPDNWARRRTILKNTPEKSRSLHMCHCCGDFSWITRIGKKGRGVSAWPPPSSGRAGPSRPPASRPAAGPARECAWPWVGPSPGLCTAIFQLKSVTFWSWNKNEPSDFIFN